MYKNLLSLFFCAAIFAVPAVSAELNKFEKSLLTKQDSTNADKSKMEAFEKSLADSMPTEMTEVYKLREELLESSKVNDTARVAKLITEIEGRQTRKILPIKGYEKGFLYVENKMFNRLREYILHFYKTRYDTLELDPDFREAKEDGLELYVTTGLDKRDKSKNLYYFVAADIEKANMTPTEKEELAFLMLLQDAYKDKDVTPAGVSFVENQSLRIR